MMAQALKTSDTPHALVIRFTDLTPGQSGKTGQATSFDIEVDGLNNNWYIDLWQPGRRYVAELGLRRADSTLRRFVRSNEILVPRAEPSTALEFNLAQYKGAKPISRTGTSANSSYSVAHLARLLPSFGGFPDVLSDPTSQTIEEPEFPGAPLKRVQNWDAEIEPPFEDDATPSPERYRYGKDFPVIQFATINESPAYATGNDSPIDFEAVPELPETDPLTIAPGNLTFEPAVVPEFLSPRAASVSGTGHKPENFPQINIDALDTFHREGKQLKASLGIVLNNDWSATASFPGALPGHGNKLAINVPANSPTASNRPMKASPQAQAWPAPKPVIALEETMAESFFSAGADNRDLNLSVRLELTGTAGPDKALTLFGEPVEIDEQGQFYVRVKLDKGPLLAALLRAQHGTNLEAD
jgi:hypothetical protein